MQLRLSMADFRPAARWVTASARLQPAAPACALPAARGRSQALRLRIVGEARAIGGLAQPCFGPQRQIAQPLGQLQLPAAQQMGRKPWFDPCQMHAPILYRVPEAGQKIARSMVEALTLAGNQIRWPGQAGRRGAQAIPSAAGNARDRLRCRAPRSST